MTVPVNESFSESFTTLPTAARVLIIALVTVQLTLAIVALVRLARTPPQRLLLGSRWPWLVVILLGSMLGPIIFLAVGRTPEPAADPATAQATDPGDASRRRAGHPDVVARTVEVLYGDGSSAPPCDRTGS